MGFMSSIANRMANPDEIRMEDFAKVYFDEMEQKILSEFDYNDVHCMILTDGNVPAVGFSRSLEISDNSGVPSLEIPDSKGKNITVSRYTENGKECFVHAYGYDGDYKHRDKQDGAKHCLKDMENDLKSIVDFVNKNHTKEMKEAAMAE